MAEAEEEKEERRRAQLQREMDSLPVNLLLSLLPI